MPCTNLDLEELDVDMEEIESRLYSQIYHSSETEDNSFIPIEPPKQDISNKEQPRQETLENVDVEVTAESDDDPWWNIVTDDRVGSFHQDRVDSFHQDRVDSFQQDQPQYISIEPNEPRNRKKFVLSRDVSEKALRRRENKRLRKLRLKEQKRIEGENRRRFLRKLNQPVVEEIVVISDDEVPLNETKEESDEIPSKQFKSDEPDVGVSQDELSEDNDDVIIIEVPRVVITIDDDKEEDTDAEEEEDNDDVESTPSITDSPPLPDVIQSTSDTQASAETTILPPNDNLSRSLLTKPLSNDFEEAELLSIPESNSNDFLENVNLNRPDVLDNELDLTVTPTRENISYICDYDSQSSSNSSEANSPISKVNFLFNTPQKELNLDGFTNYMASKLAFTPNASSDITPSGTPKSSKQAHNSINDFETSSESEYDYVVKKIRNSNSEVQDTNIESDVHPTPVLDSTTVWEDFTEEEDDLDEDLSIVELLNVGREKGVKNSTPEKKKIVKNKEKEDRRSNFSDFWTDDMNKFYRESWGQEDYNVDVVKKNMPDDPNKWKVINADKDSLFKTPQGKRCHLCKEVGHRAFRCPKKNYQPCSFCASISHLDNNCPHSLCTTCGRANRSHTNWCKRCNSLREVKCKICCFRGHEESRCPDLWRRYMFTTANGPIQKIANTTIKPSKEMWCPSCASSGHYQFDCRKRFNPYSSTSTRIYEFKDVYNICTTTETTKPAKQKDSSLINKENNTFDTANNVRQHLKLSRKESEKLTSREGFEFLTQINRTTGLQFKVMTQNFKHSARKYFCIIEGCQSLITDAKFAIKNYCGGKSLSEVIHRKLIELDRPYKTWYHHGKALYRSIEKAEKCNGQNNLILKQCKLGAKYSTLNMMLIGKLMILDGRKHMDNLRTFDADRTGKLLSNDVRTSYDYVFNKCERLKVDYQRLIADLPRSSYQHRKTMVKGTYKTCLMYCSKRKMFTKKNSLNKLWKNVVDTKFSENAMDTFCKFCSTIITMSPKKK